MNISVVLSAWSPFVLVVVVVVVASLGGQIFQLLNRQISFEL
jgi:hypothetical protein